MVREFKFKVLYQMEYLLGGTIALLSRVTANDAAAIAYAIRFEATRNQLHAHVAATAAAGKALPIRGRTKRLVILYMHVRFY